MSEKKRNDVPSQHNPSFLVILYICSLALAGISVVPEMAEASWWWKPAEAAREKLEQIEILLEEKAQQDALTAERKKREQPMIKSMTPTQPVVSRKALLPPLKKTGRENLRKGMMLTAEKKYDEAIIVLSKALEEHPIKSTVYYQRGMVYLAQDVYANAIQDFTLAIREKSDFAAAFHQRAKANRKIGHLEEAVADHNRAIRINDAMGVFYFERALSYKELGEHQKSDEDMNVARRLGYAQSVP